MSRAPLPMLRSVVVAILSAAAVTAQAQATDPPRVPSAYGLIDPGPLPSLMPGLTAPWLIETATGLGGRHELRLSARPVGLDRTLAGIDGLGPRFDARATWRYTVYEHASWAWRLGLTSPLGGFEGHGLHGERAFGSPLLHVAGDGRFAQRWTVGFDADSTMNTRRLGFDIGLRVSYRLSPNFSLIGAYRFSDYGIDGEDPHASRLSNSANVGLRLRF